MYFKSIVKNNIREMSWVASGQILMIFMSIISIKVLTSMPKYEFGMYSLVLTLVALFSAFIYGPAEQGFIRYYYEYKTLGLIEEYVSLIKNFLLKTAGFVILLTLILYFVGIVFYFDVFAKNTINLWTILNMGYFVIISSSTIILNSLLNILRERKTNTLLILVEKSVILSGIIICKFLLQINAQIVFLIISLVNTVVFFYKANFLLKKISVISPNDLFSEVHKLENANNLKKQLLKFCLPFVVWGITGWLQISSDKWIISSVLSIESVALFSLLYSIVSYLISMPIGIIGQFIQPIIYGKILDSKSVSENKEGYKILNYTIVGTVVIVLFFSVTTYFFGELIIKMLSNKSYVPFYNILPVLCVGVGVFQIAQFYTTFGVLLKSPNVYLPAKLLSGAVAVILNYLFATYYGLKGISIAIVLTSLFYMLMVIYANKYRLNLLHQK